MPRYFFHLRDNEKVTDIDGTDLKDIAAARDHAFRVASELMFRSDGMLHRNWSQWMMSVRDSVGTELFSFSLGDLRSGERSDGK